MVETASNPSIQYLMILSQFLYAIQINTSYALYIPISRCNDILYLALQILVGVLLDGGVLLQTATLLPRLREDLAVSEGSHAFAAGLVADDEAAA